MTLLIIRQYNKKETYINKFLVLQLGPLSPVHINEYIHCPSTSLSCGTRDRYRIAVSYVPVPGTSGGFRAGMHPHPPT